MSDAVPRRALVLGVAGGSGSGKTTVVQRIVEQVGPTRIAVLHHDRYYADLAHLPLEERRGVNLDHPNAFDNALFAEHLDALIAGRDVEAPTYDYATYARLPGTRTVASRPVVLAEGILLFADPELRRRLDIKVFVDADADLRLMRRLRRDVNERGRTFEGVLEQYERTVRPMHLEFVEPSKRWADVVIPRGGRNEVAIEMVVARVERLLAAEEQGA